MIVKQDASRRRGWFDPAGWFGTGPVKKSKHISLVLSGALATGAGLSEACHRRPPPPPPPPVSLVDKDWQAPPELSETQSYTNNHYTPGVGYYHAPFQSWYPYPYNFFAPGWGYYHGGRWSQQPNDSTMRESRPTAAGTSGARSMWLNNSRTRSSSGGSSTSTSRSSSTSRGGFGSSSRSTAS
ncbi:MAG: hypothetical protein FJ386_13155 [Verrucomicrobia bacterium]|nr:hypothetical protein [Verrucomicrobiota bacterium]